MRESLQTLNQIKRYIVLYVPYILSFPLLIITLFQCLEVIRRYYFGLVFEWGQDIIIYSMISCVALFFAVTQIKRGHLAMSAVIELLTSWGLFKTVAFLRMLVSFTLFVFCTSLSVSAWPTLARSMMIGRKVPSLIFYLWPFQAIFMLGIALMGLIALVQAIEDVFRFVTGTYLDSADKPSFDI